MSNKRKATKPKPKSRGAQIPRWRKNLGEVPVSVERRYELVRECLARATVFGGPDTRRWLSRLPRFEMLYLGEFLDDNGRRGGAAIPVEELLPYADAVKEHIARGDKVGLFGMIDVLPVRLKVHFWSQDVVHNFLFVPDDDDDDDGTIPNPTAKPE